MRGPVVKAVMAAAKERRARVVKMRLEGLNFAEIGYILGVHRGRARELYLTACRRQEHLDPVYEGRRGRCFSEPRTMYDWRGPRPDWYKGPLRSEGDPPPEPEPL
jgi:hypothetical protein